MPTADFKRRVDDTMENIRASGDIDDRNKELIGDYKRDKTLNGLSEATLAKNLSRLKVVGEHVEQPFEEMDKSDVKDLIEWVHSRDYAEQTVYTYKNVIRTFFKWLDPDEDGGAPDTVTWMNMNYSNGNDTLPKDLLTKDDIEAQAEAAKNPRDKALIWLLYETGARIGEIIDLTVGDIEDRKHGKKVVIDGKTGARRLPLVESVPPINKWLNDHPNPEKDAPLWCKIQQGGPDDKLGYRYIRDKILAKNMDRAGIDKPSNPHHYRHSRASYLANELKEAQLCEWFGWVQGSDVPAKYVHLSGRDIDNAYDAMHGLYEPEEEGDGPDVIECPRCEELNDPKATFCMRCGFGLDPEKAVEFEEETDSKVKESYKESDPEDTETHEELEAIEDVLEDPEVKELIRRKMMDEG